MNEIVVLGKTKAQNFSSSNPWACISIGTDKADLPQICTHNLVRLLQLTFADADEFSISKYRLFTPKDAESILDFVNDLEDKIDILMVHCNMGVSRSPAVAGALAKIYFNNDEKYFKEYFPNMLVFRTILNLYEKRLNVQ